MEDEGELHIAELAERHPEWVVTSPRHQAIWESAWQLEPPQPLRDLYVLTEHPQGAVPGEYEPCTGDAYVLAAPPRSLTGVEPGIASLQTLLHEIAHAFIEPRRVVDLDDYWDEEAAVDDAAVRLADELGVPEVFQGDWLARERVKNAEARKATKRLAAFLDPNEGRDVVDDFLELRERLAGLARASGVPMAGGHLDWVALNTLLDRAESDAGLREKITALTDPMMRPDYDAANR